ncbi:MAG: SusC/RagA family TonB-linked outer membrane protein [Tannerella sp.]|jgi:TonB-linked SusC/RagA family outer membrane protein|nr:SusC/RagA family TonB-linked outer membrane protein [Tannerella sp.]
MLLISHIGYIAQEIAVGNQTNLQITLAEDSQALDEVVVIGYGTIKKKDLTGAVAQVKAEQYQTRQSVNVLDYLNGAVAGFNTGSGTSASGSSGMEIRGQASISANNTPLIVLDGVIYNGSINDVNPLDIETIDVLKDASSAAVYGARSAAGVVIINTKRGKGEKPTVDFSMQLGMTDFTKEIKPMGIDDFMKYRKDFQIRTNPGKQTGYYEHPDHLPSGVDLSAWQNYDAAHSSDPLETWMSRLNLRSIEQENYRNGMYYDWYDNSTRTGLRQNYDVSLSGGTARMKYYWSLGYTDNMGKVKGDAFKTIRSRINADAKVTDFLNVGVNAQFANRDEGYTQVNLSNVVQVSPLGMPYNDDGSIRWYPNDDSGIGNPFSAYDYRDYFNLNQQLFTNLYADVKLPFGFSYRVTYVNRFSWNKNYYFDPIDIPSGSVANGIGERINTSAYEWQIDNIVSWKKTFGIHDFYATFLYNAEKRQAWKDTGHSEDFSPNGLLGYHQLQSGISQTLSNTDEYSTGTAIMGRLNYTLLDRYLLTLSARRDGYSAFGQNHPYALFPSGALAWNIYKESFMKSADWLDNLKIRISYGVNGNRDIGIYEALAKLGTTKYLTDGNLISGVYSNTMANSDLKWEKTAAFNIGLDFAVCDNRLSGTLDYYDMSTTDLLLSRSLPAIIGYQSVMSNMGELLNKGFETTLNANAVNNEHFSWNSTMTFSMNRNKIKHLYGEMIDVLDENGNVIGQKEADDIDNRRFIGQALDRIWDYEFMGIYQLGEEDAALPFGKAPGDVKLYDADGNGVSTQEDKTFQGYTKPRYRLGWRNDFMVFKNFQVSFFLRADLGHHSTNALLVNTDHMGDRRNNYDIPYWTSENPTNSYTRQNTVNTPVFAIYESRSFVRLQDLSVSYDLPQALSTKLSLNRCRIYVSSRNLLTLTKWSGWDPESGNTPMPRIFTFGINLSL